VLQFQHAATDGDGWIWSWPSGHGLDDLGVSVFRSREWA